jgi:hypothetical protein
MIIYLHGFSTRREHPSTVIDFSMNGKDLWHVTSFNYPEGEATLLNGRWVDQANWHRSYSGSMVIYET